MVSTQTVSFLGCGSGRHRAAGPEPHQAQKPQPPLAVTRTCVFFPLSASALKNRIMEPLKVKVSKKTEAPTSSFYEWILWRNNNNKLTPIECLLNPRHCSNWFILVIYFSFTQHYREMPYSFLHGETEAQGVYAMDATSHRQWWRWDSNPGSLTSTAKL